MDSKNERTVAVPVLTLEWWRQLAHDNPQDLPPRIDACITQAEINRRGTMALNKLTSTGEIDLDAADFSDALMWLKEGKRVARAGWNGAGQFAWMVPDGVYPARMEAIKGYFPDDQVPYGAYFALKNAQGTVVPWVPSVGDLLAIDWQVVG